jgi:polyisoprenyl-phosphate glycosyltransferase
MNSGSTITIIIPFYNEEKSLPILIHEIKDALREYSLIFLFVNDGSIDNSKNILENIFEEVKDTHIRFKLITLSRNFGHQSAIFAGLQESGSDSDYFVVIDSDLQDNPFDLQQMILEIKNGYECIYAVRKANSQNKLINKLTDYFYLLQNKISQIPISKNAGTFSIFTLNFKNELLKMSEKDLYLPGLRAYVGFKQKGIPVTRRTRPFDHSRVGIVGLINLALNGVLGFSNFPLRLIFLSGLVITVGCILVGLLLFWLRVFTITKIPGVTTVLITVIGLFGIQFMFLGILGEYLGKLFIESKSRPRYFISDIKEF